MKKRTQQNKINISADFRFEASRYLFNFLSSLPIALFLSSGYIILFGGIGINLFGLPSVFILLFFIITIFVFTNIFICQKDEEIGFLGLAIFVFIFFMYGNTHAEWIRMDRDAGFISMGGKIFQDLPLFNLSLTNLHNIPANFSTKAGGIYFTRDSNFTPIQGFPGTHEVYSLLGNLLNENGYPLLVGPTLCALIAFLAFAITKKITNSKKLSLGIIAILFSSIPMLYTGRTTFSETIILLLDLTLIFMHVYLKDNSPDKLYWILSGVLASSSLGIRADGILTTFIPWLLYATFNLCDNLAVKNLKLKLINILVVLVPTTFGFATLFLAYKFSPIYFIDNIANIRIQICLMLFLFLIYSIIIFNPGITEILQRRMDLYFKIIIVMTIFTLVFVILRGLNVPIFNFNYSKVYPYTAIALNWYFSPFILILIFLILLQLLISKNLQISRTIFSLFVSSLFLLGVYGYDLGLAQDEPWGARGQVRTLIPVLGFWIVCSFALIEKNFKNKSKNRDIAIISNNKILVIVFLIFLGTLMISRNFIFFSADKGQLDFINKVCKIIEEKPPYKALIVDQSAASWAYPIRENCKINVIMNKEKSPPRISDVSPTLLTKNMTGEMSYIYASSIKFKGSETINVTYEDFERPRGRAPRHLEKVYQTLSIGEIFSDVVQSEFKDGFFSPEFADGGEMFAWTEKRNTIFSLAPNATAKISLPPCLIEGDVSLSDGKNNSTIKLNQFRQFVELTNPHNNTKEFKLTMRAKSCQLSETDSRKTFLRLSIFDH